MKARTRLKLSFCFSILILVSLTAASVLSLLCDVPSAQSSIFRLTATTSKPEFYLREFVNVLGDFTQDGSPVSAALVSIEVLDPEDDFLVYRTIPIGDPHGTWSIDITDAVVLDQYFGGKPIDSAEIGSMVYPRVTVYNPLANSVSTVVTLSIYDGNLIPLFAAPSTVTVPPHRSEDVSWSVFIPEWAYSGQATIYCNAYSDFPKDGGLPYTPEKSFHFQIKRNLEAGSPYALPISTYTTSPGKYNLSFRVPPDRYTLPGTYSIYVVARVMPATLIAAPKATFNVESYSCPPQAAFTYLPLEVYANMTVTFDASSSSAEGYNDTIIRYEWTFNDPNNPETIIEEGDYTNPPSPLAQHAFAYAGTYTVDLNVTDNEGLWSTTSKPISILPEFGPTANFTWSPAEPIVNKPVTFDASSSEPGWSALLQDFSPIETYKWNFSDGTGIISVPEPIKDHNFTVPGNYTVTLEVVDSVGRSDTTWRIVEVENVTTGGCRVCDFDSNGIIEMKDIYKVVSCYGCRDIDPCW